MTGGEKIIARILEEADARCEQILKEAEQQAEQIAAQTASEIEAHCAATEEATAKETARIEAAAESSAQLAVRNAQLACRREEIERTLNDALASLYALPETAYFEVLTTLLRKYVSQEEGVLHLNARDIERMPDSFKGELKAHAVTVSDTPVAVEGGFILSYGDIEQNCTFSALMAEKRDALEDLINRELFK